MLYRTNYMYKYNCIWKNIGINLAPLKSHLSYGQWVKTCKISLVYWQQHNSVGSTIKGEVLPLFPASFSACLCRIHAFVNAGGSGHLHSLWLCKCDCVRPSWSQLNSLGVPGDLLCALCGESPQTMAWVSDRHMCRWLNTWKVLHYFLMKSIQEALIQFPVLHIQPEHVQV